MAIVGYGAGAMGGTGGTVINVSTLNDSGAGSLRTALTATGPRIIRATTSGLITLNTTITINDGRFTFEGGFNGNALQVRANPAGMTAPLLMINQGGFIFEHMRFRRGATGVMPQGQGMDCIRILDGATTAWAFDHCDFMWGLDELVEVQGKNGTFQYCLFAEGLSQTGIHPDGEHSRGLLMRVPVAGGGGQGAKRITVYRCLHAHNTYRNPEMNGYGEMDIVNCVKYDYRQNATRARSSQMPFEPGFGSSTAKFRMVKNFYKAGPETQAGAYEIELIGDGAPGIEAYVNGNIGPHRTSDAQAQNLVVNPGGNSSRNWIVASPTFSPPAVPEVSATAAYSDVLANVGAQPRDSITQRVVDTVANGTGSIIDDPSEVGGWDLEEADDRAALVTFAEIEVPGPPADEVQFKNVQTNALSITATYNDAPTPGNLLVAMFGVNPTGRTRTGPNGWNIAFTSERITCYWKLAASGEPSNVTCSVSGTGTPLIGLSIWEVAGAGELEGVSTNSGTGLTSLSTNTTPSLTAPVWAVAAIEHGGTVSNLSWSNSYVAASQGTNPYSATKREALGSTETTTAAWTTSRAAMAGIAAFSAEAGGADRHAEVMFAEMETASPVIDPRAAQVVWAEMVVADAPRRAEVTFAEMELDIPAPNRHAEVTYAELEVSDAPRRAEVLWAEVSLVPDAMPADLVDEDPDHWEHHERIHAAVGQGLPTSISSMTLEEHITYHETIHAVVGLDTTLDIHSSGHLADHNAIHAWVNNQEE